MIQPFPPLRTLQPSLLWAMFLLGTEPSVYDRRWGMLWGCNCQLCVYVCVRVRACICGVVEATGWCLPQLLPHLQNRWSLIPPENHHFPLDRPVSRRLLSTECCSTRHTPPHPVFTQMLGLNSKHFTHWVNIFFYSINRKNNWVLSSPLRKKFALNLNKHAHGLLAEFES